MRIPQHKIEDVRAATDILSVVQSYVSLKKKGQNYFGLCPFHTENTPSFSVNPSKGIYRCFGCGRGGNVFGFIMEIERLSFIEAVRLLAEKAGIELPVASVREDTSESEELVRVNGWARDFFHRQLTESQSTGGREAREYLAARGYGPAVIDRFLLGYAPDSWDALAERARADGIAHSVLVQAGLLKEHREQARTYDAFRHRIIFPIRNLAGRVIAFGGRALREEEGGAKYINSPETVVYRKGREMFGLWEARDAIRKRDEAFLVEGYTDCLSMVMAGVTVTVASLGTALTEQQARLLKRFTAKVVIIYDGDSAGLAAARRGVDVLLAAGLTPKIIVLPEGEDPDSFVRKQGGEAIWKLRNDAALSPVDLQLVLAKRAKTALADAAKELVASAALISSPVDQDIFLQEISAKTAISLDALRREMGRVRTPPRTEAAQGAREAWPQPGPLAVLAQCLVRQPEIRADVFAQWQPEGISDARMAELLGFIYEEWQGGEVSAGEALLDRFTESPVRDFIVEALFESEDEDRALEIDRQMAEDCLRALRADGVREEIAEIKRELKANPEDAALLSRLKDAMQRQKERRES